MLQQKVVIGLQFQCKKCRSKALSKRRGKWGTDFLFVHNDAGVTSVAITGESENQIEVIGDGIGEPIGLAVTLRKRVGSADMVSVEEVKEKEYKSNEPQEEDIRSGGDLEACEEQPELEVHQIVYDYSSASTWPIL